MNLVNDIYKILQSDFERQFFDACLVNLNDTTNVLRLNNFAYSIRELSRHFLHSLAPSASVELCCWFKAGTEDKRPTRRQRIKYAIQGGISDEVLENWGFDVNELNEITELILLRIDWLSKYTHVTPEVFNVPPEEVEKAGMEVLAALQSFVEMIESYRNHLKTFLDGKIDDHMMESLVSNFFENVDCLAPHHSTDFCFVSEYHIQSIDHDSITVSVTGILDVTLEYGSRNERSEGDGLDLKQSFPFETTISYEISDQFPSDKYEVKEYDVDTSEWYR